MKVKSALVIAALQILVLAFMAGQREWIARTGTPLVLRTAPIDPNDPMRGAYVRLDYEISAVPAVLCRDAAAEWTKTTDYREMQKLRDRTVYAALTINEHGIAELVSLSDVRPGTGPFLRGRVVTADSSGVRARFGIEALFMSGEAAQRTERTALHEKMGAPMNVRIAVGSSGTAVLKEFEWEPLGLTFAIDRPPERPQPAPGQPWQQPVLTGMMVTLHNYGDQDLAIVNLPGGKSFRLVPNLRLGPNHYAWAHAKTDERPAPTPADIIVLKPGAKHELHLDMTDPRWWVVDTRKSGSEPIPLQKIPQSDVWSASFRLEYAPPPADVVRGLPNAGLIRHAPLRSRAFNANQGVD